MIFLDFLRFFRFFFILGFGWTGEFWTTKRFFKFHFLAKFLYFFGGFNYIYRFKFFLFFAFKQKTFLRYIFFVLQKIWIFELFSKLLRLLLNVQMLLLKTKNGQKKHSKKSLFFCPKGKQSFRRMPKPSTGARSKPT